MIAAYVYRQTEPDLWTVGYWRQDRWEPESDHTTAEAAAARVHYLNGGNDPELLEALRGALAHDDAVTADHATAEQLDAIDSGWQEKARAAIAKVTPSEATTNAKG